MEVKETCIGGEIIDFIEDVDNDPRVIRKFETFIPKNNTSQTKRVTFSYRDVSYIQPVVQDLVFGSEESLNIAERIPQEEYITETVNFITLGKEKKMKQKYLRIEFLYFINIFVFLVLIIKTGHYFDFSCTWILLILQFLLLRREKMIWSEIMQFIIPFTVIIPLLYNILINYNILNYIATFNSNIILSFYLNFISNLVYLPICLLIYTLIPNYKILAIIFIGSFILLGLCASICSVKALEFYLIDILFSVFSIVLVFIAKRTIKKNVFLIYAWLNQIYHLFCWLVIFLLYKFFYLKCFISFNVIDERDVLVLPL